MGNMSSSAKRKKRGTLSLPKKYGKKDKIKVSSPPVVPLRDTKNRSPEGPRLIPKDDTGPPKTSPQLTDSKRSPEIHMNSKIPREPSPDHSPKIRIAVSPQIIPSTPQQYRTNEPGSPEDEERERQIQARHGKRTVTFTDDPVIESPPQGKKSSPKPSQRSMIPDPTAKPTKSGILKPTNSVLDIHAANSNNTRSNVSDPPDSPTTTTKSDSEHTPQKTFDVQKLKVTRSDPAIASHSNPSPATPKAKTWAEMMALKQQKELQEEREKMGQRGRRETATGDPALTSLMSEIESLASSSSTGVASVTFGKLISSSRQSVSDITSILHVAKQRNLIKYDGNFLLEGVNNNVSIFVMSNKIRT